MNYFGKVQLFFLIWNGLGRTLVLNWMCLLKLMLNFSNVHWEEIAWKLSSNLGLPFLLVQAYPSECPIWLQYPQDPLKFPQDHLLEVKLMNYKVCKLCSPKGRYWSLFRCLPRDAMCWRPKWGPKWQGGPWTLLFGMTRDVTTHHYGYWTFLRPSQEAQGSSTVDVGDKKWTASCYWPS